MRPHDPTLAGRYLADRLSPEERAAFESALQQDPEVVAEVEATARLKVGLARLRETGELQKLLADTPRGALSRLLPLAAGLAALAIGVTVWQSAPPPAHSPSSLARSPALLARNVGHWLPVEGAVAVFRKRSGSLDAQATLPESHGALELRVLPTNPTPSSRYGLTLAALGDNSSPVTIGSVEDLTPAADGFVTAYVDTSHLSPGRYRLTLSTAGPSGKISTAEAFDIELQRRDNN